MICRLLRHLALAGICLLVLSGCGQEDTQNAPTPPPKKIKVSPAASPKDAKPQVEDNKPSSPGYVYDPAGLRDPFEALVMIRKPVVDNDEPLTPLQQFDLSQFRLSAVVVGKGEPTAMVVAPGGKAYVITAGTKIGKNGGVVSKISADAVFVKEKYYDFTGKLSSTNQEIRFTQKAGDK